MIVDSSGRPFESTQRGGVRASGPIGQLASSSFPYEASNISTQEMNDWFPTIRSPDAEINQYRDRMVARSRDLARNDGWASGGITRVLDNTVGASLRLSANPDYRALAAMTGNKAFDAVWAEEYRRALEGHWRGFSDDIGRYNDVSRQMTVGQQMRLAMRHKLIDGDDLVVVYWMPERVGYGGATYCTSYLVVDPDRLSNPFQMQDTKYMRGGVEIDDHGVPLAYHIRKAHQNDWYNSIESMEWERIEREDEDGWQRVIHDFERDRAGQNRGIGVFTPVLARFKMLARYYGVELQAATIAASLGTYVTSPYDPALIQEKLGAGEDDDDLTQYQDLRLNWNKESPATFNGVRVPALAPGEEIVSVSSAHPHGGFGPFAAEMLRTFAAAIGVSAEQITQDWSKTNYSSARAALLESWKTLTRRSVEFKTGTATPMYGAFVSEVIDRGDVPLPSGAPSYIEARTHYARCDWLGVARGWVDPVKEKQGAVLGMDAALSTLKRECAEQGMDYEEVIQQRAVEVRQFKEAGLPPPNWSAGKFNEDTMTEEEGPTPDD
ncbi:MAG: phage portal protein [Candidimonas sp.]|nr:MAG: phage portal protein [Candidimonas sp.]TAM23754.1 MAG: phage portal protein [Candidimonas sp.]